MRLCDGLGIQRGDMVAFTGGGGKTSALVQLSHELQKERWRVLATTTTRIAEAELKSFPYIMTLEQIESPQVLSTLLSEYGCVFLYDRLWNGKALGLEPQIISQFTDLLDTDTILIEADGSRQLPLKAPYSHEPVIPRETTLAVPIVGLDVLGKPFTERTVYNPESIIERYGFPLGGTIHPAWIAQIVRDEGLGLKGIPEKARIVPLLNKAGTSTLDRIKARRIAQMIMQQPRVQAVLIGRVRKKNQPIFEVQRRVGAIILAGGLSRRMGQSKPLLPWGNHTVIETIVRRLTPLRLADVVVVTGHQSTRVKAAIKNTGGANSL